MKQFRSTPIKNEAGFAECRLIIIGAGASGMAAAVSARETARGLGVADDELSIILLERNHNPGAKIRISGGGKCNITHEGDVKQILQKGFQRKNEERFLRHAIHSFTNDDLRSLLDQCGVATAARPDGKVFPVSERAVDVIAAWQRLMKERMVELITGRRVISIGNAGKLFEVCTASSSFLADSVIVATGGVSWSSAGTEGDGLRFASDYGHMVIQKLPALAPVYFREPLPSELSGISLRAVLLMAESAVAAASRRGDVLITHRGISGPACLSLSRRIAELCGGGQPVSVFVDLFPEQNERTLAEHILLHAGNHGSQPVRKFLQKCPLAPPCGDLSGSPAGTIPNGLVPLIMNRAEMDHDLVWSALTRKQRAVFVSTLKKLPLGTVRTVPLDHAEVSAGGVSLAEVNPANMESRRRHNLYFCGEVLDYAGEVGGFNLQAAFSTGWAAGMHAVRKLSASRDSLSS
jgi:predicted Rossmann fold flavoprotein